MDLFTDRTDAGRRLAERLEHLRGADVVVLGLPRGGVPVAYEVATALRAPLDVLVVRKLGVPFQPELAMGAIGEEGVRVLDKQLVVRLGIDEDRVRSVEARERAVLDDRLARLRAGRDAVPLDGRTAVVVDDGIATGATASVACRVARLRGAARVVLAVPVLPADRVDGFPDADELVAVLAPRDLMAVGQYYRHFEATPDDEVVRLLDEAARQRGAAEVVDAEVVDAEVVDAEVVDAEVVDAEVVVPADGHQLGAHLAVPGHPTGMVLFAHGSGSSRHSRRNRFVAGALNEAGIGTLLLDLLTQGEEDDRATVFDIPLLAGRLLAATDWVATQPRLASLPIGYFGASTGAGAALVAAADAGRRVFAVVSRGGRPDLAGDRLPEVTAPTLLVVGGADEEVLELNRSARARLRCPSELAVVPGATHLFEEPGALAEVSRLAGDWFRTHLDRTDASTDGGQERVR
ncbi:MAG TPA: phosphoribosyltransferase family protein [Intrasporangium sp.]|uniref:phosphoribosyltransferase family protein n=1 Tax=Intrasporangium sp. TaxID=1925024 RepID=UPI002D798086|nr:phosphoribosyltransferase family protein [Intrasporangium sp.]HET7398200.1 phosphoribosyltransferase family protein [Intrasporangium sp.]